MARKVGFPEENLRKYSEIRSACEDNTVFPRKNPSLRGMVSGRKSVQNVRKSGKTQVTYENLRNVRFRQSLEWPEIRPNVRK